MNNFIYKTTDLELSHSLREYVEKRLAAFFKKYQLVGAHVNVEIGKLSNHHKNGEIYYAEAYFKAKKGNIFARVVKVDLYEAIDHLQDELVTQLEGLKGKRLALFKRGASKIKKLLKFDF
jgi:ribosomal subunit interface protein